MKAGHMAQKRFIHTNEEDCHWADFPNTLKAGALRCPPDAHVVSEAVS